MTGTFFDILTIPKTMYDTTTCIVRDAMLYEGL